MDWAAILKVLKIPLKILLPALCLFSGILIFGNEGFLQKMNLLDWSKTNGFIFGLIFLISSCLIVIYLSFFLFKWIKDLYIKMSIKRKCFKTIGNLDWAELEILANLYKKYGYTDIVDSNQPIIQGLISRNLIYFGGQQLVLSDYILEYGMVTPIRVMLQPIVWQSLDEYIPKVQKYIGRQKEKLANISDSVKAKNIEEKIENAKDFVDLFIDNKN